MTDKLSTLEILVEYEETPIRRLVVKCPHCENYFYPFDVFTRDIMNKTALDYLTYALSEGQEVFECPKCGYSTDKASDLAVNIQETCKFPKACVKKVVWE